MVISAVFSSTTGIIISMQYKYASINIVLTYFNNIVGI